MVKSALTEQVDALTNEDVPRLDWPVKTHEDYRALREAFAKMPQTPRLVHADEVIRTSLPGRIYDWLITSEQSGGTIVLQRMTLLPGFNAGNHNHIVEEEFFYVLEGELEITIGNATRVAGPGTLGYAPPNATHAFATHGDQPCVVLHWNSPGGHERLGDAPDNDKKAVQVNYEYVFHKD